MSEPQHGEDYVHQPVEHTPTTTIAPQPTLAATATSTPATTGALSTHDLLQMMLSMLQSMNTLQLSMAEERAVERKAREAREIRELAMREKMLEIEQKKLEDMQATREQAMKDAAAQQRYHEEHVATQRQARADEEAAQNQAKADKRGCSRNRRKLKRNAERKMKRLGRRRKG